MSGNEPRPLPPRALPPLSAGASHGGDRSPARTPRKKTRSRQPSGDPTTNVGGSERPSTRARPRKSPRQRDETGSAVLQPSSAADETQMSEASGPSASASGRPRNKRRKRPTAANQSPGAAGEASNTGNTISAFLQDEDVVNVDKIEDAVVMTNLPGVAAGSGGSAVTDKVYVQTTNGFATHNQDWVNERIKTMGSEAQLTYGDATVKPSNIAEQNERAFMFITLLLHGALAGFSIWQVVISYSLNNLGEQNLLTQYQSLAMPTQTVYYIILILCFVSAMDRYDFAARDKHIIMSLAKFDLAAVAAIVYFIALMFSVGMVGLEAWIGSGVGITSTTTTTTTISPSASTQAPLPPELAGTNLNTSATVNTWLILNVFRAVFACLGWLIVAFDPLRNDMTWE